MAEGIKSVLSKLDLRFSFNYNTTLSSQDLNFYLPAATTEIVDEPCTEQLPEKITYLDEIICHTAGTDIGKKRKENQDSVGIIKNENFCIFMVADGMGGYNGGAIASCMAIDVVKEYFEGKTEVHHESLREAVENANKKIYEKGASESHLAGMGTTFVAVAFCKSNMSIVSVGDSRLYRFREGAQVEQLTRDQELNGNLTEAVGHRRYCSADWYSYANQPQPLAGDKYLLCSDGLHKLVKAEEMSEILNKFEDLDEARNVLIKLANDRGGNDNISLIIVTLNKDFSLNSILSD